MMMSSTIRKFPLFLPILYPESEEKATKRIDRAFRIFMSKGDYLLSSSRYCTIKISFFFQSTKLKVTKSGKLSLKLLGYPWTHEAQ